MRSLHLQRNIDVNKKSGIGQVWDGCEFSDRSVTGSWFSETPSYGYYPSLEHLKQIHSHKGKTEVVIGENYCANGGVFLWLVAKNSLLLLEPDCPDALWIAEGMRFRNGWVCLLYLAKYTSIYWYPSLNHLEYLSDARSHIITDTMNTGYPVFDLEHPIWQREQIFKE